MKHLFNVIIDITDKEFKFIAELVYNKFGINLPNYKKDLVKGRLNKLIQELGFTNFSDYIKYIINDKTSDSLMIMIDKITTNQSYFFREIDHFEFLKKIILPEIIKKNKTLKIWCAGCACGEEAYTLAMVITDFLLNKKIKHSVNILASDISSTCLKKAEKGIFPFEKINKTPDYYRLKYFNMIDNKKIKVKDDLKNIIYFKKINLIQKNQSFNNKFDIIFCRNVMIYFDMEIKKRLIEYFHEYLKKDGYLFIGHSETLFKYNNLFKFIKSAVYKKI